MLSNKGFWGDVKKKKYLLIFYEDLLYVMRKNEFLNYGKNYK